MTSSSTLPFSSSVLFSGAGISNQTGSESLKVTQAEFMHDTAEVLFWGSDVDADALASGTPVTISFGTSSFQRVFHGYVNHAGRTNNTLGTASTLTARNAVKVTCVGASWPMKQAGNQVFVSQTASQIVQTIATMFGFSTNIVPDTTVWASRQMAGMSYWQFCVSLAKLIGYTFYCNDLQLVFKPRRTNPNNLASLAATYDYSNNPAILPVFSPVLGATSPSGGQLANRQLAGINPRTSQVIYSQVSGTPSPTILGSTPVAPAFNRTEHFTVNSQAEADAKTSGAGALNQLFITATALAGGNAAISQGSMIFVQNANGSQNGLWFVTKAMHMMTTDHYTTNLEVGRDSTGATATVSFVPRIQTEPAARLNGTTWLAA